MLSTTELFVEHIISGILSLVWIVAIMLCFTGIDPTMLPVIKDVWGLLAVVGTAIAYPIGIFVDTIADMILEKMDSKTKIKHKLDPSFSLLSKIDNNTPANVVSYFTYNRFKTRVARSSFINFAMIGFCVTFLIRLQGASIGIAHPDAVGVVIFITFNMLSATAFFLWWKIADTVYAKSARIWGEEHRA